MLIRLRKKGQNTVEYAILIGLVIAAAVGMQLYVKRGLQARSKGAIEYLANTTSNISSANFALQYEPYYANSSYDVTQSQQGVTTISTGQTVNASLSSNVVRAAGGYTGYTGALNQD